MQEVVCIPTVNAALFKLDHNLVLTLTKLLYLPKLDQTLYNKICATKVKEAENSRVRCIYIFTKVS